MFWLNRGGRVGLTATLEKAPPPDVAVVGGITDVSAEVFKHLLGAGTAPGIKDLHTAHQGQAFSVLDFRHVKKCMGWGRSSVTEHVFSIHEVLDSISSNKNKQNSSTTCGQRLLG